MSITIGQYYPGDSFVHRLDPRTKLIFLFVYIFGVFMCDSLIGFCLGGVVLALAVYLCRAPFLSVIKGLRGVLYIAVFTAVFNILFTKEGSVIFKAWILTVTDVGVLTSAKVLLRLALIIIMSSVVTLSTTYMALANAIECFLDILKPIGVPAHDIAMMTTIALRFVPTLFDDLEKIKLAQMSRGASFDEGSFMQKIKSIIPLLIPLFVSSFRTADVLALAMEARCYRGDVGRTKYKVLSFCAADHIVTGFVILFGAAEVFLRVWR